MKQVAVGQRWSMSALAGGGRMTFEITAIEVFDGRRVCRCRTTGGRAIDVDARTLRNGLRAARLEGQPPPDVSPETNARLARFYRPDVEVTSHTPAAKRRRVATYCREPSRIERDIYDTYVKHGTATAIDAFRVSRDKMRQIREKCEAYDEAVRAGCVT